MSDASLNGFASSARGEQHRRASSKLERELGPVIRACLADPSVIEIMLNPDGRLWVERAGRDMEPIGVMTASDAERLISTIAGNLGKIITYEHPALECRLPGYGSRFAAMLPPGADGPMFTIRRHAGEVFTLSDYVTAGIMTTAQMEALRQAIRQRRNILVAGGTGSGKTTLTAALIGEISRLTPHHRLIIIEDTPEISAHAENAVILRAAEDSEALTMRRLVLRAMRHRPDRIILGEVRDGAALDLLKAWNTGHPGGIATIHANDDTPDAALIRLESLVGEAAVAPMQSVIAQAIDVIAVIVADREHPAGRRLKALIKVGGYEDNRYQTEREEYA
ncbi:MAG: P-type conjugative transfer ATPase TrbB [Alphaproteobacteria bacterium]